MSSANDLVGKNELKKVKSYPLAYYICTNCGLLQQINFVSRDLLFVNYPYITGVNKVLVDHFKEMSMELRKMVKHKNIAVVIGSNDGTEVNLLKAVGFKKAIGIEPSDVAEIAKKRKIPTIKAFFTYNLSIKLVKRLGKAYLITANNVFAHIPDPKDMLKGMANLIKTDGIISIEVHSLGSLIKHLEIEALYAEHYFVWSVKAMQTLSSQVGLKVHNVIFMPEQHGGSLRFIIKKGKENFQSFSLPDDNYNISRVIHTFQKRADIRKQKFVSLIKGIKKSGKKIGIWSVPAKIPTLINFCGLTNKDIDYAYEIANTKIGKYIPKANIKIKDEKEIPQDMPDYLIIGAWNYIDFAKKKLEWYLNKGGKLINPLNCRIYKKPQHIKGD